MCVRACVHSSCRPAEEIWTQEVRFQTIRQGRKHLFLEISFDNPLSLAVITVTMPTDLQARLSQHVQGFTK